MKISTLTFVNFVEFYVIILKIQRNEFKLSRLQHTTFTLNIILIQKLKICLCYNDETVVILVHHENLYCRIISISRGLWIKGKII